MMTEPANETTVDKKLVEIFEEAFDLYYSFDTCNDPTNSPEFQENIKKCIRLFEDCTRLVSICGLFSSNESYKELPTNDLKYLLLPFLLGNLSQKICGGSRVDIVEVAEVYFKDFLKRSAEYELYESQSNAIARSAGDPSDEHFSLTQSVLQRNQKLEKYRQKKELEDQIKQLKMVMKREHVEDEMKRDFYVKLLKLSVIDAQEEISSIDQEKQILEFQKNRPQTDESHVRKPAPRPLKPIIITKDLAQKAVYGLGYPSFPTMTVNEFYDQRVAEGIFPDPTKPPAPKDPHTLQARGSGDIDGGETEEDIERERKLEEDDDYEIARLRARDEYKDDHRRGEGNRHNRS